MAEIVIPVLSARGTRHGETLRFLRAEIRKRHVWGSFSMHGGDGASGFEAGYQLGVLYDSKPAEIEVRLDVSRDKSEVQIRVTEKKGVLTPAELRDFANSLLLAAVDAARASSLRDFWIRRHAYYFGKALDGWYILPGWRIAPAPDLRVRSAAPPGSPEPRVVALDVSVQAIDRDDALERSFEVFTRRSAHAAFCLWLRLRWPPSEPALLVGSTGELLANDQWRSPPSEVGASAEPFDDPSQQGKWGADFMFPWLNRSDQTLLPGLRFPEHGLSVLRHVRKKDRLSEAFDSSTRLYHLSLLLPEGFRSAAAALTVAAIEALAKALPEFESIGADKVRFSAFMARYGRTSAADAEHLYGRWRSALFHAGRFSPVDGAYANIDCIDDATQLHELEQIPEAIRRAFAGWAAELARVSR